MEQVAAAAAAEAAARSRLAQSGLSDTIEQRNADLEKRSLDLARQAVTDPLTLLPNRKGINEHLVELLAPMEQPDSRAELALLFLDLDEFKEVNDQHGHLAGDAVLRVVAERLRESLPRAGFAARWGGDEFIVVLPGLGRIEQVRMVAEKLRAELCVPIRLEDGTVRVGCSIGIALAPYHGRSPETLIIAADQAVYAAKTEGRDRVRVFDVAMAKKAQRQHQIAQALPGALERNQLTIAYQPIVAHRRHADPRRGAGALAAPELGRRCRRASSCRWPSRTGRSTRWAAGCCARPASMPRAGRAPTRPRSASTCRRCRSAPATSSRRCARRWRRPSCPRTASSSNSPRACRWRAARASRRRCRTCVRWASRWRWTTSAPATRR